jgi:hypothetical protein
LTTSAYYSIRTDRQSSFKSVYSSCGCSGGTSNTRGTSGGHKKATSSATSSAHQSAFKDIFLLQSGNTTTHCSAHKQTSYDRDHIFYSLWKLVNIIMALLLKHYLPTYQHTHRPLANLQDQFGLVS